MSQSIIAVTGATGLVGANVCQLAAQRGDTVRALVRSPADVSALRALGVDVHVADVTDLTSLEHAFDGANVVIHCAAQIGGSWSTAKPEDYLAVNQTGSINVLEAAARCNLQRTVMLSTPVVFERAETLTELSRVAPMRTTDSPYLRTKRAAYYESMARAARGQDIVTVIPGGVYGPSPFIERALHPTSFDATLLMAVRGELTRYIGMVIAWSLAEDVANISLAAAERGESGARYLACGRAEDACTLPGFCNRFLELAGISKRVATFNPDAPGAADDKEFGSMLKYLQASYPQPLLDCSQTTQALGIAPTPLDEGLSKTRDWLAKNGKLLRAVN